MIVRKEVIKWIAMICATAISTVSFCEAKEIRMKTEDMTLFAFIDKVVSGGRIDKATVEAVTGVKLSLLSSDEYTKSYAGHGFALKDTTVGSIDYREAARSNPVRGSLLVMDLNASCITKSAVLARYKPLTIIDEPRGRSLNEETAYARSESWGRLSFGFAERARDCLSSIAFDTNP
jgi:hypothetical protein